MSSESGAFAIALPVWECYHVIPPQATGGQLYPRWRLWEFAGSGACVAGTLCGAVLLSKQYGGGAQEERRSKFRGSGVCAATPFSWHTIFGVSVLTAR